MEVHVIIGMLSIFKFDRRISKLRAHTTASASPFRASAIENFQTILQENHFISFPKDPN